MEAAGDGGDDCRPTRSTTMESAEETAVQRSMLKRKTTEPENEQEGEEQEYLPPSACVIEGSKHADGSIYRQEDTHFCHRLYRLDDTGETLLKPTNLSYLDTKSCKPDWKNCRRHTGCAMMQVFSLKLANHSATTHGGRIELYGFMAARDLLQPLRNYIFNRTRDDPLVLHPSPDDDPSSPLLIQMASPKRGIYLQARAMIEFDVRIKKQGAQGQDEDLQLIDGAATFSELTPFHGVYTQRIHGDHGGAAPAVDISLALLRSAVEARVRVVLSPVPEDGLRLSLVCLVGGLRQEIQLFDGSVGEPGVVVNNFVVAAVFNGPFFLNFKVQQAGDILRRSCAFPAKAHGCTHRSVSLDVAAAEVEVSWANLLNN